MQLYHGKPAIMSDFDLLCITNCAAALLSKPANEVLSLRFFNSLVNHYQKFGKVTFSNVKTYIEQGNVAVELHMEDVLIYGIRGAAIKPKTSNQKNFIDTVKKNDVVFAVGPA